jgi:hypothetical protein
VKKSTFFTKKLVKIIGIVSVQILPSFFSLIVALWVKKFIIKMHYLNIEKIFNACLTTILKIFDPKNHYNDIFCEDYMNLLRIKN